MQGDAGFCLGLVTGFVTIMRGRLLAAHHMQQDATVLPLQRQTSVLDAEAPQPIAVEAIDVRHHPVQPLRVIRQRLPIAGMEIHDPQHGAVARLGGMIR